jgi:hypothetical protein
MSRVIGIEYSPTAVWEIRQEMITLRAHAMRDGELAWAISLSWTIAFLAEYAQMLETMGRAS